MALRPSSLRGNLNTKVTLLFKYRRALALHQQIYLKGITSLESLKGNLR